MKKSIVSVALAFLLAAGNITYAHAYDTPSANGETKQEESQKTDTSVPPPEESGEVQDTDTVENAEPDNTVPPGDTAFPAGEETPKTDVAKEAQIQTAAAEEEQEEKNYLKNGDFSSNLTDWGKYPENANAQVSEADGEKYVSLTADHAASKGGDGINQDVTLETGKWYELSGKVCADTVCGIGLEVKANNNNETKVTVNNKQAGEDGGWEEISLYFQAKGETNNVAVWLTDGTGKATDLVLTDAEEPLETTDTFYIDAAGGNDENAGTSPEQAWQSFDNLKTIRLKEGGSVLLKAGGVWNNEKLLIENAAGTKEAPVRIGRYGEGADPVINGNGSPWQKNENAPKEDVAAVHIYNSSHVIIENLEVTNEEKDEADLLELGTNTPAQTNIPSTPTKRQSKSLLTGILVENHDAGKLDGVTVQNNYVHNVNGRMRDSANKGAGGIVVLVTGSQTESSFQNLKITGNKVENVCHQGIYMESSWASRPLVLKNNTEKPGAGTNKWVGWEDMVVSHNWVNEVAGDGIVLINADGGLAEYNLVTVSADEDWNYMANPAHAAIWMWDCNNVTMQYNEAAYTESYQDGMAFDFDYGNQNVLYQYNYSHNNKGGFWMSCPGPAYTVNAVARYNISINDGGYDGARMVRVGEPGSVGNQFHNNTMYWDHDYKINAVEQGTWGGTGTSGTDIYNNIFFGDSDMVVTSPHLRYSNNCVYGSVAQAYPVEEDPGVVIADPQFTDVGQASEPPRGKFENYTVSLGSPDGFTLQGDSPCIDAGRDYLDIPTKDNIPEEVKTKFNPVLKELVDTQIEKENKDYFGNTVPYDDGSSEPAVDIGAVEYQGTAQKAAAADRDYLEKLVAQSEGIRPEEFLASTYDPLPLLIDNAKKALENKNASAGSINGAARALEEAVDGLIKLEQIKAGQENTLQEDNAAFEGDTTQWGKWQTKADVGLSNDHAYEGSKSLKVGRGTLPNTDKTVYAEIGDVPVKRATQYLCTAWVYSTQEEAEEITVSAKYYSADTALNKDIKLGEAKPVDVPEQKSRRAAAAYAADSGQKWRQAAFVFTTADEGDQAVKKDDITLAVASGADNIWVDNVSLTTYTVEAGVDKTSLQEAIAAPIEAEQTYTTDTWAAYQETLANARLTAADPQASETQIQEAEQKLRDAYNALQKRGNKESLQKAYEKYKDTGRADYTLESWNKFQEALAGAYAVLEDIDADQTAVDQALALLEEAFLNLAKEAGDQNGGQDNGQSGGQNGGQNNGQNGGQNPAGNAGGDSQTGSGSYADQGADKNSAVKTGDDESVVPALILLILSVTAAAGAAVVIRRQRKSGHKK